ncbi:MAG: protein kinase [Candidatus Woesearchaeota archaeon]
MTDKRLEQILEATKDRPFDKKIKDKVPGVIERILRDNPGSDLADAGMINTLRNLARFKGIRLERMADTLSKEYILLSSFEQYLREDVTSRDGGGNASEIRDRSAEFLDSFSYANEHSPFNHRETFFTGTEDVTYAYLSQEVLRFQHFSQKTISNVFLLTREFAKKDGEPRALQKLIEEYKTTIHDLDDDDLCDIFDTMFNSTLRHKVRGMEYEAARDVITGFFDDCRKIGKVIKQVDKRIWKEFFYGARYMEAGYSGEKTFDTQHMADAVNLLQDRLNGVDHRLIYSALMCLGMDTHHMNLQHPCLVRETPTGRLRNIIEVTEGITRLLENEGMSKELVSADEIERLKEVYDSAFKEFINHYNEQIRKDIETVGHDSRMKRRTWYERFKQELFNHSIDDFVKEFGVFYLSAAKGVEREVGRISHRTDTKTAFKGLDILMILEKDNTKDMLGSMEHIRLKYAHLQDNLLSITKNPLSRLFLNFFLKRWNMRQGPEVLDQTIDAIVRLQEKGFSEEDRLKVVYSASVERRSKTKEYCTKVSQLTERCTDGQEIMECASINTPYMILKKLGEGKGGSTYLARVVGSKGYRALKVINSKEPTKEAELMERLKDQDLENFARVYDSGRHIASIGRDDRYSVVMEYVEGKTLKEMIQQGKMLKDIVLKYSVQIFNGITALQNNGIFHRDLNPANIMVGQNDTIKIIDFGIATDDLGADPQDARSYGGQTDFFPLALITYEMAAGEHLILPKGPRMDHSEHANAIARLKPQMYFFGKIESQYRRKIEDNIPKELQGIIFACLENDDIDSIRDAYESAQEDLKYFFMSKSELIDRIRILESAADIKSDEDKGDSR